MSAKSGNRYLLVVTVLTGRNFPQRPTDSLRIDVRFDGQLLSSLPVPMAEEPVFDMDMAFRLTGKQLKDHKVQRTPIKIDVMKVNRKTKKAEKIGYQTLDLRSYAVEVSRPRFSWFPLLGATQLRGKPELHLGVSLDDDVEAENSARSQKEFTRSARNKEYWMLHQPMLVNNPDGTSHYQLGPSKDSTHIYMISVIIGYASNIDKFFDRISRPPPDQPRDFFFHYELVNNHLTTKPFSDFEASDLAPERISLKLKTHYDLMRDYFLHEESLKIKLCHGEGHIIASAEFLFDDAFKPDVNDLTETVTVEKELVLHPFPENRFGIPEELVVAQEDWPVVGVSFEISVVKKLEPIGMRRTLTLDSAKSMQSEIENFLQNSRPASAKVPAKPAEPSSNIRRSRSSQNLDRRKSQRSSVEEVDAEFRYSKTLTKPIEPERPRNGNEDRERTEPQSIHTDPAPPKDNGSSRVNERQKQEEFGQGDAPMWKYPKMGTSNSANRENGSNGQSENGGSGGEREDKRRERPTQEKSLEEFSPLSVGPSLNGTRKTDQYSDKRPSSSSNNGLNSAMDKLNLRPPSSFGEDARSSPPQLSSDVTRRYICTIFLYKIRIISPTCRHPIPVYLRYQYPFFGSAAPIMTRPAIEVQPKIETVLDNNSLTQFSFGCSESQLLRAFRTAPVCVEVWKSGMGNIQDELIGQAKLRLDLLYRADVTTLYENEKPYSRRLFDAVLEVIDLQSEKYPKLAELTVCTTLDDYGSVQRNFIDTISVPSSAKEAGSVRETVKPDLVVPASNATRVGSTKLDVEELRREAMFELEVWREREEKKFKAQLKQREDDAMKYLTEEWERRSKQQKAYVDDIIERNRNLENELRRSFQENSQKDAALKERERRVSDAERFLKNEKAKLTQDIEEMQDNVIKEYSKRLELEHSAQGLLKAEIRQLQGQVEDFRKAKSDQEEIIKKYQDAERQKPYLQREAQAEIDRLTLDKNDLERRCAAITESKEHYKQQWQMALKEIAKMRDRVDSEHERRLNEKDREITNLRMELERAREPWNKGSVRSLSTKDRYHRENEKSSENSPRRQRLAMQFDNQRKTNGTSNGHSSAVDGQDEPEDHPAMDVNGLGLTDGDSDSENRIDSDDEDDDHPRKQLIRAMEERNVLLKTGIYKPRDTVIVDLDKKIARLRSSVE